ncbi:MAG: WbqC family protein [Elusimicrobiota bacterium]
MKICIHQPQYMPWLGYLDKINSSDRFVVLDDVQYNKREFQNRNRIRTPQGSAWLTAPVMVKGNYLQKINEVKINNSINWREDHIKALELNYSKSDFFDRFFPDLKKIISVPREFLRELNMAVIEYMLDVFRINTPHIYSSQFGINSTKTERIIDICKKTGAGTYLSGRGAAEYLDEHRFSEESIELEYQDFIHPEYKQCYSGFISHMSAVDYLFNCGTSLFSDTGSE